VKSLSCLLATVTIALTGCSDDADLRADASAPVPAVTVTATVTATETVTAEPDPLVETVLPTGDDPTAGSARQPQLKLEVFSDGCGVIRSETPAGASFQNLTWTFLDQDGFQVLGRNAEGETRYRYFQGGTYTVVLEAWGGSSYVPVSNEVTVHC
jgi:hypothetical protein